jgi:hypothetical protein
MGRLARGFGYRIEEIEALSMCDAVDLVEYLSEHPTADDILGAVHLDPKARRRPVQRTAARAVSPSAIGEAEGKKQMLGLRQFFGPARPLPPQLREMASWAEEQKRKMAGKAGT